jgi:hypothetical protein
LKPEICNWRARLKCSVAQIDDIFPRCMEEAERLLTPAGIERYLDGATVLCGLGRGQDLPVIFLQTLPLVARTAGEAIIDDVVDMARVLSRSTAPRAIVPFLEKLPACTRRLETRELLGLYFDLVRRLAQEAPQALAPFFQQVDYLLGQICIGSLKNWVQYGLRTYRNQPHKVADYFSLQTADARAALQRERKGTLLADQERKLRLTLHAFWGLDEELVPYTTAFDIDRTPWPHLDKQGFHVPDVYDEAGGVSGLDRYRAALAHLAAHRLWSKPFIADNFNRYQQVFIETFEDARVEHLAMQRYPGLRNLWLKLHPRPRPGDCPEDCSPVRHLAAMLSRALLDPDHGYTDPVLLDFIQRFRERMACDPHDTTLATELGVAYLVKVHQVSFRSPKVFFRDTMVSYRDDNRYLWIFLEDTDDEDDFHSEHNAANPRARDQEEGSWFARRLPEWDSETQSHRPDWVTVYESLQKPGSADVIDSLLARHDRLAKKLKRVVDQLKPQNLVRERYQEDGSELDLDIALRAVVDLRAGTTPDPRIHFSHRHDERDIAVTLLMDLSESVNNQREGQEGTVLELSQEAAALLAWAEDQLGDPFSIAGFCSNTRHDVRYFHFKTFAEPWGEVPKARLAGMQGAFSTRMGAALRHAGHYLAARKNAKKLLILLTDGEPSDIDVPESAYLRQDARQAVEELEANGVTTWCVTLDPKADDYVTEIFGNRHLVVDRTEQLPEKLSRLFLSLTK